MSRFLERPPNVRPAHPKPAASLVLLREGLGGLEVLLGRRGGNAKFMAGRYVFPGGRVHPSDRRIWSSELGHEGYKIGLGLRAHARAALRETFEETGLLIGRPSIASQPREISDNQGQTPIDAAYQAEHFIPPIDELICIGRAITPASSPIRFDAYFFMMNAELAVGPLRAGDELEDLRWHHVESRELPLLADVTRFMLRQAVTVWRHGISETIPLYSYVRGAPKVTWQRSAKRRVLKEVKRSDQAAGKAGLLR